MKRQRIVLITLLLAALATTATAAAPTKPLLHPLFGNGAVLQRDVKVPVWGWAEPGEQVTVEFAGQKQAARAGPDGKWMVRPRPDEGLR